MAGVDDVLGVVKQNAANELQKGVSHLQVVAGDVLFRVEELEVECQVNLLEHLFV